MSGDKVAIRGWTRTQSRLGRKAARPVVVSGLLSSLLGVGQAWCVATVLGQALVGLVAGGGGHTLALRPVLIFAGLALLRALIMALSDTASAKAGINARRRLRGEVLASILTGGPALLRKTHSGELATIAVDRVEALDGFFARWVPASSLWIAAPLLILVPVGFIQPKAALVLGLCGATVPFGQALFGIGAAVASRNQFLAMTRLQARFLDRVRGIATIVLAGRADDETQRLGEAAEELRKRTMKILRVAFLSSASIDCAMVVALVLIAIMDGKQAMALLSDGASPALAYTLTSGLFVLLVIPEFFAPLRSLALAYQDRAHAQGAATAILDLPEAQPRSSPEGARTVNASGVMISLEDVCFTWDPARGQALDHVSFTVPAGETLILAGPSGSGKSTIMELLLGFIQPDSGSVRLNGAPLDTIVPDSLSRMISWIGQKPVLFAGTLRDNILFARQDADEADLMAAVKAAAVDQFLPSLPDGLETRIGEGGFGLSGGQAQRIAIARAYLKNAPILLLDEPTAHLDPATEKSVFESLQRLALRRTVVLATHSAAVHMFNGRRVDLHMGRVVTRQGAA
ncbi:thiol reductant ABC exporter subunit CydD [Acetobacter orleanensis]|uniref:Thiol reductant ABC exporter subunit CydD n=1 Tax=Acetobacter orleanensis TaxID=104099 RepID=A0A4Y3TL46_9PROT|nr:thiol reductant ABC exporter subunit CydD [Acetobacter orleanensis]KXV63145.1 ABC transporter ATP-binding protein [Acetobacter orleanensis]PCD80228.1 thiol reductant ABC exporter subunit CydD [Acetobacter orleanensis]GAN69037.1 ABC transporter cysteine exporter CydD [Acetobacter orleanensis JCM 7639]GEB81555.1 thiol reductant ABC exporter subunit CydD [Acetobacter orleanensis]